MPLVSAYHNDPKIDGRQSDRAMMVRTGVIRGMSSGGITFLAEMTLSNGRRADLIGLDQKGEIVIVEIKSSFEDFKTDAKWHEYLDFCDRFYFATHNEVPIDIFPDCEGLILADKHGCEIIHEAEYRKLSAPTRKTLTLKFARQAADRLKRFAMHEQHPGESLGNEILAPEK